MKVEKSAGIIIFRKVGKKNYYLLLQDGLGYWGFPKGHVEKGETLEQTARREVQEETGLKEVQLRAGFKKWIRYIFRRDKQRIFKLVCFFLGKVKTAKVVLSFEHQNYQWLPYYEAQQQLSFKNTKNILKKAQEILSFSNSQSSQAN